METTNPEVNISRKSCLKTTIFIGFFLCVLLFGFGYFLRDKIFKPHPQTVTKECPKVACAPCRDTNSQPQVINGTLTSRTFYIGPSAVQLYFDQDYENDTEIIYLKYVGLDREGNLTISKQKFSGASMDMIFTSPNGTKILTVRHAGDMGIFTLYGVEKADDFDKLKPITPKSLDFQKILSAAYVGVVSWLDNDRLLVVTQQFRNPQKTYYIVSVSNPKNFQKVDL